MCLTIPEPVCPSPYLWLQSLDASPYVSKKQENRIDKVIKYILVAGKKALADAGMPSGSPELKELDITRAGILIGTAMGGMSSFTTAVSACATQGAPPVDRGVQQAAGSSRLLVATMTEQPQRQLSGRKQMLTLRQQQMTAFVRDILCHACTLSRAAGHRKMNPFCIPFSITNMGGAMLAMETGFMGPNYSLSTACATGNYCIAKWVKQHS